MNRRELENYGRGLLAAVSDEIDRRVEAMADEVDVSSTSVAVPRSDQHDEVGSAFFHDDADGTLIYEARDRGRVVMRKQTTDPDGLVYWVVDDVARSLAKRAAAKTKEYDGVADPGSCVVPSLARTGRIRGRRMGVANVTRDHKDLCALAVPGLRCKFVGSARAEKERLELKHADPACSTVARFEFSTS